KFLKAGSRRDKFYRQSLTVLNSKIKSLEDSNAYYEIQFSKLQMQLNDAGESESGVSSGRIIPEKEEEEEEDWKELYYQENEDKVRLENELDQSLQNLEAANRELVQLKEKTQKTAVLNSLLDTTQIELNAVQNQVQILEKKLIGATQ